MKKLLLLSAIAGISLSSSAQARLSLYEEFSGENCAPCALYNPGLWTLVSSGTNPSKILLVKYQVPIPSAGPIYLSYTSVNDSRLSYYFPTTASAPTGTLNGKLVPGAADYHVANLDQAAIDAAAAAGSPFNIEVTANYNSTGDTVSTTVKVTCVAAYAPAGASLKLRIGMIEHLVYATAPGTNGEKDFHNVIREMYPNPAGTAVKSTWAIGDVQTYVVTGRVRSFVKKSNGPKMVAWIQNDADKAIPQSAISAELPKTFPVDMGTSTIQTATTKGCIGGTGISGATVTLSNFGTSTATAATIYYRLGTGAWASQPWTGSLAAGGTTTVTLGTIPMPTSGWTGYYALTDSVVFAGDQDVLNNVQTKTLLVMSGDAKSLPYSNTWESGIPDGYLFYDSDGTGNTWLNGYGGTGSTYCHSGIYMPWYRLGLYPTGTSSMIIIPTPAVSGSVALDFWEAYAPTNTSSTDKLEVVYSTDCGATWTGTLWSATGTAHATTAPTTTSNWLPSRLSATDWVKRSVSLNSLPAKAILAIRATDGGGNNLFIDDINVRAGLSVAENTTPVGNITVSPNPAATVSNVQFDLAQAGTVQITLVDVMGKVVSTIANENMTAGNHNVSINLSGVASGVYMVKIATEKESATQRISVVK